ncbi:pirin family protein [Moraxella canis]|uniref:Quercetin 2,3-dioxygenase n=1 Tax=Moraxella canis TaxID=90239 RepID=A0A1S9ZHQ7_9GAMM|nr:pirin family protein [Moraxella canis]OOR82998.1 quercetin 2,3-dioxygenase [Moraxella canis]
MKQVSKVYSAPNKHWVGDGFHVHSMFNYQETHKNLDPFLMMDYAAPQSFPANASTTHRGVGEHPHRGFETVTIAYQGEVEHRDSAGGGGVIGTGDVQWMTAGAGLMHEEFHSEAFSKAGGIFEMVQLWVNLPAKDKMTAPRYQAITKAQIPEVDLQGAGIARLIAGELDGTQGAASTFSPVNLWDVRLKAGHQHTFTIPESHNLLVLVLEGTIQINEDHIARSAELVTFHRGGSDVKIVANNDAKILILSGEPLNEPIVGYGPFVMNSREEILQAMHDVQSGKFGQIPVRS